MKLRISIIILFLFFIECKIKNTGIAVEKFPVLFETAFIDNTKVKESDFEIGFKKKLIGNLKVSSGKIIACDPLVLFENEPFNIQFPVGVFPVELSIAHIKTDQRVAFARILFSDERVARWDYALLKGQDPTKLKKGEIFGYGVDSGTGAFMDIVAHNRLSKAMEKNENLFEKIIEEMDKTYVHTRSWCIYAIGEENAAMFSSGYGDGGYQSYAGYDEKGNICRLLTDFQIVSWAENR